MIHLDQPESNEEELNKGRALETSTETLRPRMISIGTTQALILMMQRITGDLPKAVLGTPNLLTITPKTSTKPSREVGSHLPNKTKAIEQMLTETPRKRPSGEADIPKRKRTILRPTTMQIPLDLRKALASVPTDGTLRTLPTQIQNTTIRCQTSINLRNKELECTRRRKRCIKSMNLKRTQISMLKTGGSKRGKTCLEGPAGKHGSILAFIILLRLGTIKLLASNLLLR